MVFQNRPVSVACASVAQHLPIRSRLAAAGVAVSTDGGMRKCLSDTKQVRSVRPHALCMYVLLLAAQTALRGDGSSCAEACIKHAIWPPALPGGRLAQRGSSLRDVSELCRMSLLLRMCNAANGAVTGWQTFFLRWTYASMLSMSPFSAYTNKTQCE